MSAPDRRDMLDCADKRLSICRQCALLGVTRSGTYRPRKPANDDDLGLMRRIDELFITWPFLVAFSGHRCGHDGQHVDYMPAAAALHEALGCVIERNPERHGSN